MLKEMFQQLYSQYNVRPNSSFPALEDNTRLQGSGSDKGVFLLYRYMFPPSLKHPTLAVVGVCPVLSPVFPKLEMQCRWATRVFKVNYSQKCYVFNQVYSLVYDVIVESLLELCLFMSVLGVFRSTFKTRFFPIVYYVFLESLLELYVSLREIKCLSNYFYNQGFP